MEESLLYTKKSFYENFGEQQIHAAKEYAENYKAYLDSAKTEREAVTLSIAMAKNQGFEEFHFGTQLKKGGKYYYNNRGKSLFLFTLGSESLENGIRIVASHIDSPRLDLKQCPLYEDEGMSFFKTHYYGGIRKYQWLTTPLALHGVVVKADGTSVQIVIGENESDPIFYIDDLLPHLSHEDDKKPLGDAVSAEKLNVLMGSEPLGNEQYPVKYHVLKLLNEKYGITEEDFLSAELCFVPAQKARDVGLDRSLIGAYGHDDRVCSYPALTALFDQKDNVHTLMCILADKEEIGSEGFSGMQADTILDIINELAAFGGVSPAQIRAHSKCLSADVSAAFDPNYAEVFEKRNSALLSCGTVLCKYTGVRGKVSSNDAGAEMIGWLRGILAKDNVLWQTGELGKTDLGGGGTVAKFIAKHNIETVDLGVPVLSMHAPFEVVSKVDVYETYRALRAFFRY